jgi:SEC-C motif-containing protein
MTAAACACACGSGREYAKCCGRYIESNAAAPNAETLMRSRYTAYTLNQEAYLLATWHHSARPKSLPLDANDKIRWLGLDVKRHQVDANNPDRAVVEFVARFKVGGGRAERLHEISRFVREEGRWFYVDGKLDGANAAQRAAMARNQS